MTDETKPSHSPLGASSAERWMNCPGSYTLLKNLELPDTDEPDYRREGTAAHEALAYLLQRPAMDAWEIVGETFNKTEVTSEMADALQVFLEEDRLDAECLPKDSRSYIEYPISHPDHPLFYGTLDRAIVIPSQKKIKMRDFKYGQGVMVEVEHNPQLMYYTYGLLIDLVRDYNLDGWTCDLSIIQPRGFHTDGPVRSWSIDAEYITDWAESTLLPAMDVAQAEQHLDAGNWCRFCPAKLVCPLMNSLFKAAACANPKEVITLTLDDIGRSYEKIAAVKQYTAALEAEAFRRLNLGQESTYIKLVPKKANRVFKDDAEAVFTAKLGAKAFTEPKLKSPSEMEKIDGEAKKLVREYAYTPLTGLTVATAADKRPGVKVESTEQAFPNALDMVKTEE